MKKGQRLWTRDELILAINLYCKLPFGKMHKGNPDIINLSILIDRTPGAVAYKLVNFASLDPSLKKRGIKGAINSSKLDKQIWNEFFDNWDGLVGESELFLEKHNRIKPLEPSHLKDKEGISKEATVKVRRNQSFFRQMIVASYNSTCCITGITQSNLLIAGHIKPWSVDKKNRLNPQNGLLINALHDKAFELGYITITPRYKVIISKSLKKNDINNDYFFKYNGKEIILPSRFLPDPEFLKYHNQEKFIL